MKSCKSLKNGFLSINLAFWFVMFCFFMWFARLKILICEPKSIWRKLLVLSLLYWKSDFCRFFLMNRRDLPNLASLIWKLHKHQNSIIRTIDLWSAFLAKRIQREVVTKAPFLGKMKKVKYTPKVILFLPFAG